MTDAIIYYRSRPSEPEASEVALHLQREAVRAEVEAGRIRAVGEFIEQEDAASDRALHPGHETARRTVERDEPFASGATEAAIRPAYLAALRAARAHEETCLLIVSSAAIGSGEGFEPPEVGPELE